MYPYAKKSSARLARRQVVAIHTGLAVLALGEFLRGPQSANAAIPHSVAPSAAPVHVHEVVNYLPDTSATIIATIAVFVACAICFIRIRRSYQREAALRQSEEKFRLLIEGVKDFALCMLDPQGNVVSWNSAAEHITGFASEDVVGKPIDQFITTTDGTNNITSRLQRAAKEGRYEEEGWRIRKDGSRFFAIVIITALRDDRGQLRGFAKVIRDVTEKRQARWLEDDQRSVLQLIAEDQPQRDVVLAIIEMIQRQRPDLRAIVTLGEQTIADELHDDLLRAVSAENHDIQTIALEHGINTCWSVAVHDPSGKILGAITVCSPAVATLAAKDRELIESAARLAALTVQHFRLKDQLAYQAHHDPLTNLPNRALFEDRLQQAITAAKRSNRAVGLLFVDLDRFKLINDTLGHTAGDSLLTAVAARLKNVLRESDTLCRMGGDEFTIVLPELADSQDAVRVSRRLLDMLANPIIIDGRELFVTTSVGISIFPQDGNDAQELQRAADVAMYNAKSAGGNKFQCFAAEMNSEAAERLEVETQLRRALDANEFELYYQLKVDRAGRTIGLEALLRWMHPTHGIVVPQKFIPVAEDSGLIVPLGTWVLREACRQARHWQDAGLPPVRVAVNVSALQFLKTDFVETIEHALHDFHLEARWLEIELTETLLMHNTEEVAARLARIRAMGVAVAIDDFGTGYSSLSYLQRLPIDTLKIDRSFIREIGTGKSRDNAIIKAIVSLGRSLRMEVIAEGVESEEQREVLVKVGCDGFQGFLFSKPLPATEVTHLLSHRAIA